MSKRLAIITVGKTHSGKSTFAKKLEDQLEHSFILDQDHHAEFINTYYKILQPTNGPNTLKHAISKLIVDYAQNYTSLDFIVCNANRTKDGRAYLLNELFHKNKYVRILVHFDLDDQILEQRIARSHRKTTIFRGPFTSFEEVLKKQQAESADYPVREEADYLFVIKTDQEVSDVINNIVQIKSDMEGDSHEKNSV
ncbi:ATP-binding protein [Alkalicoccobacillus gibsonii]|uniref:ATP-binding protein n=1 Tax=Alkalicoccobacillus gibsonii TaxID=79881 RepID=UPI0035155C56